MLRKVVIYVSNIRAGLLSVGEGQIARYMTAHELLTITLEISLETFQWSRLM